MLSTIKYPFQGLAASVMVLMLGILLLGKLEVWTVVVAVLVGLLTAVEWATGEVKARLLSRRWWRSSLSVPSQLDRGTLGLLTFGGLMALSCLLATWSRSNNAAYLDVTVLWAGSMALVIYAAVRQDGASYRLDLARWELAFVGLLLTCSLLVRFLGIEQLPRNFGGDEGSMALPGRQILEGRPINPFGTGWYSVPNLFSYIQAGSMALLGDTVLGARAQAAVVGTLAVVATYLLGRRVLGKGFASVAAFLLAINHMHLFFSRLSSNMVEDTLLGPLMVLLLLQGLSTGKWLPFVGVGMVLGFAQYFYFGGRLLPVVALSMVAFSAATTRGRVLRDMWFQLGITALSFAVTFAPLLGYYFQHPSDYFSRVNQVSVFQSGWLAKEVTLTGRAPWEILVDQWRKTIFVFVSELPKGWYHIGQPLMDAFNGFLLFAGLFSSLAKFRRLEYFSVVLCFFAVVLGVGLTEGAPMSQRMVLILPFVALLQAEGLGTVARLLDEVGAGRLTVPAVAVGFLLAGYFSLNTFVNVSLTYEYGYTNTTVATELAYYLRSRQDRPTVFFFGAPRMRYDGFATLPFIAPNAKGVDVEKGSSALPGALVASPPRLFVFLPERQEQMAEVVAALPGGDTYQFRKANGEMLFLLYDADAGKR
jgi:hypothetical protein